MHLKHESQRSFASLSGSKHSWMDFRSSATSSLRNAAQLHHELVSVKVKGKPQVCPDRPSFFFTNYTMHITCPTTNVFWVVRQRYSRVYANRQSILKSAHDLKKCSSEGKQLIRSIMRPLKVFPKRRLGVDDDSVIAERAEGFTNYINALFQAREGCILAFDEVDATTKSVLESIVKHIESAIEIPEFHKKEEAKWRERMARIEDHDARPEDDSTCSICLEDLEQGAPAFTNIRLGCSHAFHHECVSTWLTRHATCPLCRVDA